MKMKNFTLAIFVFLIGMAIVIIGILFRSMRWIIGAVDGVTFLVIGGTGIVVSILIAMFTIIIFRNKSY
ncbi:hypothetical protein ACFQ1M_03250 [Sungkyunkwania multivorans]|uniref:Uncharacterized protein n=1 Tax=Sungkyunkwania multivorans TaxID=1173618 RepID=A0ABW3CWK6_9FLAO